MREGVNILLNSLTIPNPYLYWRKGIWVFAIGAIFIIFLSSSLAPSFAAPLPSAKWDWQLSVENINPPKNIKAFGADPDSVTSEQILALNKAGVYTICYVSVGTLENWRSDKNIFPSNIIGKTYGDWPDEAFLDISNNELVNIMVQRFNNCAALGFLAIEPDNMDVYINDSGFNISKEQTLDYIRSLAKHAHALNLEIGQKNVPELTSELVSIMDFIITEDCFVDGWCGDVLPYIAANKPVFNAEYTDTGVDFNAACTYAAKYKISMILKDRDLTVEREICP